jgi:hypothetical protein
VSVVNRRNIEDQTLTFSPSGWTYNYTFVLWDYETGSMWLPVNCDCGPPLTKLDVSHQPAETENRQFRCTSGEHADRMLAEYPLTVTTWSDWVNDHPQSWLMDPYNNK